MGRSPVLSSELVKQHGCKKAGKIGPHQQDGHHQHIPHRLPALKLHHAGGDEIPILPFLSAPAVDHGVKQNHIKAHQAGR